ncbi:response regulator [Azospirillum sp. SYSU D00513]|uniref:response regulator n=1 Tax=Azospirillum sp. SYSU D00513 TaxID=2812561 RepID=UPI001A9711F8|nr:response regulator [Azospirillum sp. SYSU D00513]
MMEDNVTPLRPGTAKRLLVIDDSAIVRAYYRQALEPAGYAVEEAFNGLEALEKALTTPFDLAIVDVNMPKMDGLSFVRRMRATEEIACLPVLMTSTLDRDSDIAAARAAGVNLYVVKPIAEDELRRFTHIMTGAETP